MDNIEFCNLVKGAKKMSGVSNVELVIAMKKSQGVINDMLRPRGDYSVYRYLSFLNIIGFYISVTNKDGECTDIQSESDLSSWTNSILQSLGQSSYELGEKLGTSHQTILRISHGGSIKLSIFLKLAELTNCKVSLEAII